MGNEETWTGPSADDLKELWGALRSQWGARNADYFKLRQLYAGDHWDAEDNPPTRNRYALVANYLKPFADKDVQILMGQLPGIQVPPPGADKEARQFAENLEALLYGNWQYNKAHRVLLNVAWNSVVLRRGVLYYWWDPKAGHVRFKSCTPENVYPVYDGEDLVEVIYVSRRLTRTLKRTYPELADQIEEDNGMDDASMTSSDWSRVSQGVTDALGSEGAGESGRDQSLGYTTVIDYYDAEGAWVRMMGDAVHRQQLDYPEKRVPFIEVINTVQGDEREPVGQLDQLAGLNIYYDQLLSQRADVIKKWSNPPIIDKGSGVAAATVKSVFGGDGGVLPINPKGSLEAFTWEGKMAEVSEQMEAVKEALYDLSGKPRSAFGQTITNQSGVMTNLALTPTLQSNELRETLWGQAIYELNRAILQIYEKFAAGREIQFRGTKPGKTPRNQVYFQVGMMGADIKGWYESRCKWPSAIRTDDPAFVQMELSKLQSQPQAQSIYDTLENLGVEDVEAYIDRIRAEREDPRIHPEILEQTMNSIATLGGQMMPPEMGGAGEALMAGEEGGLDEAAYNEGMIASGMPAPALE